jgi:hypothetical protein
MSGRVAPAHRLVWALLPALWPLSAPHAEDIGEIFARVHAFMEQENYPKAIEELGWARREIEKLHVARLGEFFPDSHDGLDAGQMESQTMFGMSSVSRRYGGGDEVINVTLSSAGAGGSIGAGGLAALAQMATTMGGQQGMDTYRIQERTANFIPAGDSGLASVSVTLESGALLYFELEAGADGTRLKRFADSWPMVELDSYLSGR